LREPFSQRGQLLLLALDDHESSTFARLEQEESAADLAAHPTITLSGLANT